MAQKFTVNIPKGAQESAFSFWTSGEKDVNIFNAAPPNKV